MLKLFAHSAVIPKSLYFFHIFRLFSVNFLDELLIHLVTVGFTSRRNLQSVPQKVLLTCKNIYKIAYLLRSVIVCRNVYMRACTISRTCYSARFSKSSYNLLQKRNIPIFKNRRIHFHTVGFGRSVAVCIVTVDTSVVHNRPIPAFNIFNRIFIISATLMDNLSSQNT